MSWTKGKAWLQKQRHCLVHCDVTRNWSYVWFARAYYDKDTDKIIFHPWGSMAVNAAVSEYSLCDNMDQFRQRAANYFKSKESDKVVLSINHKQSWIATHDQKEKMWWTK